jgi:transcription elongation factor Elf1
MQKHMNLTIPLACPHCLAELLANIDQIEARATLQCAKCHTTVELRAEDLPVPPRWNAEPPEQLYCGIEF